MHFKNNLSVRMKLLLITAIPLLAFVIISFYAYFQISTIDDRIHDVVKAEEVIIKKLNDNLQVSESVVNLNNLLADLKIQEAEAKMAEQTALTHVVTFALITILIGLFINSFISQKIIRSIAAASEFIERLSKGERNIMLSEHPNDEIGKLLLLLKEMQSNIGSKETAIHDKERQMRFITDNIPVQIYYVNSKEEFEFCNLKYARNYHHSKQSIIGQTINTITGQTEYAAAKENIALALKGYDNKFEFKADDIHGNVKTQSANYLPDVDEDGNVQGFIAVINDITSLKETQYELEKQQKELERINQIDPLTGVLNRRALTDCVDELMESARTDKLPLAVLMIDLDHFKNINDTYGHGSGDEVLRIVSGLFKENFRSTDIVSRYGGEEFCIVLANTNYDTAMQLAERIRELIEEAHIPLTKEIRIDFTCSIGAAFYEPHMNNSEMLIEIADKALYEAKQTGRNKVVAANKPMPSLMAV